MLSDPSLFCYFFHGKGHTAPSGLAHLSVNNIDFLFFNKITNIRANRVLLFPSMGGGEALKCFPIFFYISIFYQPWPGAIWIDCIWCGGGLRFWHWLSQPTKMNIIQSKIQCLQFFFTVLRRIFSMFFSISLKKIFYFFLSLFLFFSLCSPSSPPFHTGQSHRMNSRSEC